MHMTRFLAGKTIIVTGASRGIGREIALRCATDGEVYCGYIWRTLYRRCSLTRVIQSQAVLSLMKCFCGSAASLIWRIMPITLMRRHLPKICILIDCPLIDFPGNE